MPPKLPNLKFKPKSDTRVKDEVGDDDPEMMSLVQRERLRQLQLQQQQEQEQQRALALQVRPGLTIGGSPQLGLGQPGGTGASGAASSIKVEGAASSRGAAASSSSSLKPTLASSSGGTSAGIANRMRAVTAAAEAANAMMLSTSEALPRNNMDEMLCGEGSVAFDEGFIRPIGIDVMASNMSGDAEGGMQSHRQDSATLRADPNAGVAFLEEWKKERDESHKALLEYFGADPAGSGAVAGPREDELLWMQLPRPVHDGTAPQLNLRALPPGKIGTMRLHKSGRCVLEIQGVEYEVACSATSSEQSGMSQVATAVLPPLSVGEGPICFELGAVTKKLLCTPIGV